MACRLFGTKPLSEPMLPYFQLDPKKHLKWNFVSNSKVFIQENALKNASLQNGGHFVSASIC